MTEADSDWIRQREISFRGPHPDPHQGDSARLALCDVPGVIALDLMQDSPQTLLVSYDLRQVCLSFLEELLYELGFHLDNSLLSKLKRALYYYTEDNQRENLAINRDQDRSTREVFMRNYRGKLHGCRDYRPEYWRKYL